MIACGCDSAMRVGDFAFEISDAASRSAAFSSAMIGLPPATLSIIAAFECPTLGFAGWVFLERVSSSIAVPVRGVGRAMLVATSPRLTKVSGRLPHAGELKVTGAAVESFGASEAPTAAVAVLAISSLLDHLGVAAGSAPARAPELFAAPSLPLASLKSASNSSRGARRRAWINRSKPISKWTRGSGLRRKSSSVCSRILKNRVRSSSLNCAAAFASAGRWSGVAAIKSESAPQTRAIRRLRMCRIASRQKCCRLRPSF